MRRVIDKQIFAFYFSSQCSPFRKRIEENMRNDDSRTNISR